MKSFLDSLKSYSVLIPFLGGYMILYGALNIIAYYHSFGIDIISYISFSEFIVYFIKDIYLIILNLFFLSINLYIIPKLERRVGKRSASLNSRLKTLIDQLQEIKTTKSGEERSQEISTIEPLVTELEHDYIKENLRLRRMLLAIIIVAIIFLLLVAVYSSLKNEWWIFVNIAIIQVICLLLSKIIVDIKLFFIITLSATLLISSFFNAYDSAKKVKKGRNYGTSFTIETIEIKSDSINFFIGKTDRYIFFYNSNEKKTIIYPTEKIEFFSIPNK